jgi:ribonuclease G
VQKDAHGDKGAYVSPALSLRSACAVLSEDPTHEVGASRKIPHEKERTRLKKIARGIAPTGHGLILRTAAASLPRETIEADVKALHATMQSIRARGQYAAAGTVLHHAPNPLTMGAHEILDAIPPEISRQLDLSPQIALPCGGNIIIEQTSACVVIDVNTGGNVTEPMQTNMNAATAIARQLRLRNLSGIIIVDFISMRTKTDQRTLTTALREATKTDPLRTDVLGLTSLGLMQITRERTRPPHM